MNSSIKSHARPVVATLSVLIAVGAAAAAIMSASFHRHRQVPSNYVAFSLRQAEGLLKTRGATGFEPTPAALRQLLGLAGITSVAGLVYDKRQRDVILVGRSSAGAPPLSLDDLVTSLRALMLAHQWPAVSIDPPRAPDTVEQSSREMGDDTGAQVVRMPDVDDARILPSKLQSVRLIGGLENTKIGESLLEADAVLKKTALDLPGGVEWGGRSYFDRCVAAAGTTKGAQNILSRFWFSPLEPAVATRDGVFVITHLGVGVTVEVLRSSLSSPDAAPSDPYGVAFAGDLTHRYGDIAKASPAVGKLQGLLGLVAAARGMASISSGFDADYWLHDYRVASVSTPRTYPTLMRRKSIDTKGRQLIVEVEGGVRLEAQLIRLHDGDVAALRDIVLESRPSGGALTWRIPVTDWQMAGTAATPGGGGASGDEPADGATPGFSVATRMYDPDTSNHEVSYGLPMPPLRYNPPTALRTDNPTLSAMGDPDSLARPTPVEPTAPARLPSLSPRMPEPQPMRDPIDIDTGIIASTTGPAKRGGRGGGITGPPSWMPPRQPPPPQPPLGGKQPLGGWRKPDQPRPQPDRPIPGINPDTPANEKDVRYSPTPEIKGVKLDISVHQTGSGVAWWRDSILRASKGEQR